MQRTDQPASSSSPAPSRLAAALSDGDNAARVPLAQQVRARTTVAAVEEHNAAVAERRPPDRPGAARPLSAAPGLPTPGVTP